jgi:hypothetical protein
MKLPLILFMVGCLSMLGCSKSQDEPGNMTMRLKNELSFSIADAKLMNASMGSINANSFTIYKPFAIKKSDKITCSFKKAGDANVYLAYVNVGPQQGIAAGGCVYPPSKAESANAKYICTLAQLPTGVYSLTLTKE